MCHCNGLCATSCPMLMHHACKGLLKLTGCITAALLKAMLNSGKLTIWTLNTPLDMHHPRSM